MSAVAFEFARWPVGTTVRAYQRKSELMMPDMPPPAIPSVASAQVQSNGRLTFDSVPAGEWWAIGPDADGIFRYVAFDVPGSVDAVVDTEGPNLFSLPYKFRTAVGAVPPPGNGEIKFNNANYVLTTQLYIAGLTVLLNDMGMALADLPVGTTLYLQSNTDTQALVKFTTTALVDRPSYISVPVTPTSAGPAWPPADNTAVTLTARYVG
jgi:hypothetical protein